MINSTHRLVEQLATRRKSLGMSYPALAARSGVSVPTLKRMLQGRATEHAARLDNLEAVAQALGMTLSAGPVVSEAELCRQQADAKAQRLVGHVQGTSVLEQQGLDAKALSRMTKKPPENCWLALVADYGLSRASDLSVSVIDTGPYLCDTTHMPDRVSKNISLTPEHAAHVDASISSGRYQNSSEYFRDLIRRDQERDLAREQLAALLLEGLDSGEAVTMDEDDFQAIRKAAREHARRKHSS